MHTIYKIKIMILSLIFIASALPVRAAEIVNTENTTLHLGGRIQAYGVFETLPDEVRDNPRILLFVRDTRLRLNGSQNNINFELEMMFGGEADNLLDRPSSGDAASRPITALLMDAWGEIPLMDYVALRAGQFKVPYSRENLTEGDYLSYTNRSINHRALNMGRDTGVMLHSNMNHKFAALAILTGGGINQRVRYIPVKMGFPLTVLRLGYNTLDDNPLEVRDFYPDKEGVAVYANALFVKNTNVGHGSVLSMRQHEKSFLLSSWNPYLSSAYGETVTQFGADFAMQKKLNNKLLTIGAEYNQGTYDGDAGSTSMSAATARVGLLLNDWLQVGARYSLFTPDKEIAFLEDKGVSVLAPAITCYIKNNLTVKMDLPVMFDAPLAKEEGLGYYNLIYQPGQTYLPVERKTVVTGRMIVQFAF